MEKTDVQESTTITFEWVLRGLKNLFDGSKGESKSKVTKSVRFGGGRWQILFYANSGTESGGFVSLYLSCEPTTEEKDNALDGKWVREGVYKFSFELRSLGKTVLFNIKEAHNHSFSSKTANWGWAQFARRDHVYYHSNPVKENDAFLIICTITSSPHAPVQPPATPAQFVPKDFLERVGALLDDPLYSDVEFVLPKRGRPSETRTIYANRKILERADYFQTMFSSGFAEASADHSIGTSQPENDDGDAASDSTYLFRQFDDSDDEEDDLPPDLTDEPSFDGTIELEIPAAATSATSGSATREEPGVAESSGETLKTEGNGTPEIIVEGENQRNVRPKLSHPSSPRSKDVSLMTEPDWSRLTVPVSKTAVPGPKKMRVVIGDVAYATYRAVLYYIYTDVIVFAPLSSSFTASASSGRSATLAVAASQAPSDSQSNLLDGQKAPTHVDNPTSRREWIKKWQQTRPDRPAPCSAKAVYRLADKLGLLELKERAYQHIQKSLSVENIPYEVFSPFSATFADVRKVQVSYFLEHWGDIRTSNAMRTVWQQIRNGRHPGFEEVWPVIAQHLEFNPRSGALADADAPAGET
ncbi:hypothetical protein HYDPIDRAFT_182673 [Hydnomerulius pinastri MD-312]|uniref:MATH domain-containing protein n=1 Tax=Hydnomerulius pinastri MD-312 TaxID=994086 RepID=A0A0C9VAD0_9AGAM|nr:hypothetical protein HYDPIDRAFT_182673 [Hydnomerulius pinastri MD-312]